jgi:hypothetical protein
LTKGRNIFILPSNEGLREKEKIMKTVFVLSKTYAYEGAEIVGIFTSANRAHRLAERLGGPESHEWSQVYGNPYVVREERVR